ncbi:MAG: HypC/HybG/HupF family hydrogenase formation chaperone [Candidatus Zixiibacteriota bacterium]
MCLAVPGKIVSVDNADSIVRSGRVDFGGVIREVSLACVPQAGIGDYVLVHAGFALSVVDPEQARITLDYLQAVSGEADSARERR